ncbi:gliding motility-associated C-terminal domain-containing protein [Pedobacter duraquae]|uniref:Gliding motility-associated-like protein n=1 Tax=Pedobacter duraquae TaxID=425511 RepID=A0A4R6IJC1_9SPHI|nr:gliding motility-associated C-terminal domain-containing protein [Pedobacter duraquae]TDO22026.1 gliding motility-associated-like protein [Pedobacter duraquae]
MKRWLHILALIPGLMSAQLAAAQLVNNGQIIYVSTGALLNVQDNYIHQTGSVFLNGDFTVSQNWTNNDPLGPVFNVASLGNARFTGTDIRIEGPGTTQFPSLIFINPGIATLYVNTEARRSLVLDSKKIITQKNTLSLLNPEITALTRNGGYVVTEGQGLLLRRTNLADEYLYPLGAADGSRYAPVTIQPADNQSNIFGVSLENHSPDRDGYNRQLKRDELQNINDKYYYTLNQPSGTSASEVSLYGNSTDGRFNMVARWIDNRIWEKAGQARQLTGAFGSGLDQVFAFNTSALGVLLNPITLANGINAANPFTFFNAFSPDGDGKNDTWEIKNIDAYPDNDLQIFDRSGNRVYSAESYSKAKSWDGGTQSSGTFYYVLRAKIDGVNKTFKGFITMVKR